jgi:hypothetical protein
VAKRRKSGHLWLNAALFWPKRRLFEAKNDFFRRFPEAESHYVGDFWSKSFPQALISKSLQIICKVFGEIYTPKGYRGVGVPPQGSGIRDQGSGKTRSSGPCSCFDCALLDGNYLQTHARRAALARHGIRRFPPIAKYTKDGAPTTTIQLTWFPGRKVSFSEIDTRK